MLLAELQIFSADLCATWPVQHVPIWDISYLTPCHFMSFGLWIKLYPKAFIISEARWIQQNKTKTMSKGNLLTQKEQFGAIEIEDKFAVLQSEVEVLKIEKVIFLAVCLCFKNTWVCQLGGAIMHLKWYSCSKMSSGQMNWKMKHSFPNERERDVFQTSI